MTSASSFAVRVIDIHEREARVFPREELFDLSGQSLLLPETRALSAVDLRDVITGIELRTLGVIGYLPLTPTIVLNIRPKFPVQNLWEMLLIADATYDKVFPILRSYEESTSTAPHLLLVKGFCHYLKSILNLGLVRGYFQEPFYGSFKPKVNFGKTIKKFLSRGDYINVSSDYFNFSTNITANKILKSACISFLKIIPNKTQWSSERSLINDALSSLCNIDAQPMRPGEQECASSLPAWVREYYFGAISVYGVFLGFNKIGFSYSSQGRELPSFLFSLDVIFENYIRNAVRESLIEKDIFVLDGNVVRDKTSLFIDNKRFPIKPDLIFKKGRKIIGIGEVKYKPKIEENDRYQVISHVIATGAPIGIWISPATNNNAGLEYIGRLVNDAKFYHYRIDMSVNCKQSRSDMVNCLHSIIASY